MLISVVIPVYNRSAYLPTAVESVLKQTYKNFELIIVDDNSSDETYFSVLEFMKDKRVCYYYLSENRGVSFARNFGIKKSRGDYISFLDSDDYWLPEKLEKQLNFMKKTGASVCQTEEIWIRRGKFVNPKKKHKKIDGDIFEKSLEMCIVSPSAVMIKRDVFSVVGYFDESMVACEDYDMWLRVSLRYRVRLLNEKLIVKRNGHDDQLSSLPALDRYRIYSLLKLIKSGELDEEKRDKAIEVLMKKCRIYINGCLKRGKRDEAEHYIKICEAFGNQSI